jgi:hypothetical protein
MEVASRSRRQSDADLVVANTLEGMNEVAYLGSRDESWQCIVRRDLPYLLIRRVESSVY